MKLCLKPSAMRRTRWHEYLVRFVFGGLVTMAAGLVADHCGPVMGGLFLAFPSIFPACVTLVQVHEEEDEKEDGKRSSVRKRMARQAAGATAMGTTLGGAGLFCFALVLWLSATRLSPWLLLGLAMLVWVIVNTLVLWLGQGLIARFAAHGDSCS